MKEAKLVAVVLLVLTAGAWLERAGIFLYSGYGVVGVIAISLAVGVVLWGVALTSPRRAVSTILRQPDSAIYCSDSTVRMSAVDGCSRSPYDPAIRPCCGSSGVTIVVPGPSWPVESAGGLIHTAVGKRWSRGGPCTKRSGCAA